MISKISTLYLVVGLVGLLMSSSLSSGCMRKVEPVVQEELVIKLERTACFGACPVYSLKINGNGTVVYEGKDFVRIKGVEETTVGPEIIDQLLQAFEEAGYFSLNDSYTGFGKSDMPHANTSISIGSRAKSIRHYLGDQSAPGKLTELEN
ncbi:MAG: hypothetical protein EHM12_02240, partial [Dehalococcoidia bacterium]